MKNLVKHTRKGILMVAMVAASLSFANEKTELTKIGNDAKTTALSLGYVKEGNQLSIVDKTGIVLYKETIQKTGLYTKGFDLTSLPDGAYAFELDADVEIRTIPFTVASNSIVLNKEMAKTIYKPVTRVKGDLVYITKLALNKEPLKINVYYVEDGHSQLMMSETIKDVNSIERVYKLTGLNKGNYKIVFNSDNKEFTKFIN